MFSMPLLRHALYLCICQMLLLCIYQTEIQSQDTAGTIDGMVWCDQDCDGLMELGEAMIFGVDIRLFDAEQSLVSETISDERGMWRFDDLPYGEYYISVEDLVQKEFTLPNIGDDPAMDSDITESITAGSTDWLSLSSDNANITLNAGLKPIYGTVKGLVWNDQNGNGIREDEESLVPNSSVALMNDRGQTVANTTTDSSGQYQFSSVFAGQYRVVFGVMGDFVFTIADQGSDDLDSDVVDTGTGSTDLFTITNQGQMIILDAGLTMANIEVKGTVWQDDNKNGLRDTDETLVSSITIQLISESTVIAESTTDDQGQYQFSGVIAGAEVYVRALVPDCLALTSFQVDESDQNSDFMLVGDQLRSISVIGDPLQSCIILDAGLIDICSDIAGQVWCDTNANGIREIGESGVSNILVELLAEDTGVFNSTFTDANGFYDFGDILDLPSGSYFIRISGINGKEFVAADQGQDDDIDSDITGANGPGTSDTFDKGEDAISVTIDAGISVIQTRITGRVWDDQSLIGVQDDLNEAVFAGLTVQLFNEAGTLVTTAITDESGQFIFNDVDFGTYYLQFPEQADYDFTTANLGSDALDSDVTGENGPGTTQLFALSESNPTIDLDAGYVRIDGSVSGLVWQDLDHSGTFTVDEAGLADVLVRLFDENNSEIAQSTTDPDGRFTFPDIPMGIYYIQLDSQGDGFTSPNIGADESIDSDITGAFGPGTSDQFVLLPGEQKDDLGAGILTNENCLAGRIWEDINGNGLIDDDEPGLVDINVVLFDGQGTPVAATRSNQSGRYKFSDLSEDFYFIRVDISNPFVFTAFNQGSDELIDSDISGELGMGTSDTFIAGGGSSAFGVNAGVYIPASISGEAWLDQNDNNRQDLSDLFVFNAVVDLLDESGSTVSQPKVTTDGSYSFTGLIPGQYTVRFTLTGNFEFVIDPTPNAELDSDVIRVIDQFGFTENLNVLSRDDIRHIDAGIREIEAPKASFGDFVWEDLNGDGIQDAGEPGLNGVFIELVKANGALEATTVSKNIDGQDGRYEFIDFDAQDYFIRFVLPDGFEFTGANQGNDDDLDSDVTGANGVGTTDIFVLSGSFSTNTVDAGLYRPVVIGDQVWNDMNADGLFNPSETGLAGVRVRLFDVRTNTQAGQQFTNASGEYQFSVPPGEYYALFQISAGRQFTVPNAGNDDTIDSDVDNSNGFGTTDSFSLQSGDSNITIDAGMILESADLGDYVWLDENANGIQDNDEGGKNGITVNLYNENGSFIATTESGSNEDDGRQGFYLFENIPAGSYYVEFILPDGAIPSDANQGDNDSLDSDVTNGFGSGTTSMFQLDPAEEDFDVDAGYFFPSAIGDFIWEDLNGDGLQDPGEPGFPGVEISISRLGVLVETQLSDENGKYLFDGLRPGKYNITIVRPAGFVYTEEGVGNDESLDNDFTPTGASTPINLVQNIEFLDFDAGFVRIPGYVGMSVFHDLEADGERDAIDGVIDQFDVALYRTDGSLIDLQQTDTLGEVRFYNVPHGDYYMRLHDLGQYEISAKRNNDQVDDIGFSEQFSISSDQEHIVMQAALYEPAELHTTVWRDANGNGLYDRDTESYLNNVRVYLVDESGQDKQSVFTGEVLDGQAIFGSVVPGDYSLRYEPAPGYFATDYQAISSGAINSDIAITGDIFMADANAMLSGDRLSDINAGFYKGGSVSGIVWQDDNTDGFQNKNEKGIANVDLELINALGDVYSSATSGLDGSYTFSDLPKGEYYVQFYLPSGYSFSNGEYAEDISRDSDVDDSNGYGSTAYFTLSAEQNIENVDAGGVLGGILSLNDVGDISGQHMGAYNQIDMVPLDQTYVLEYHLQRSMGDVSSFKTIDRLPARAFDALSFADYDIEDGTHYYRVLEIHRDEIVKPTKIIAIDASMDHQTSLNIFPNPATESLSIDWPEGKTVQRLVIKDLNGAIVLSQRYVASRSQSETIDVRGLASGIYIVELYFDDRQERHQLVISR